MARRGDKQLNWGAAQRSAFIEFRVFWQSWTNRAYLVETLASSLQRALIDLRRCYDHWQGNLGDDKSQRADVRVRAFEPCFIKPSAEDHPSRLRAVSQGPVTAGLNPDADGHHEIAPELDLHSERSLLPCRSIALHDFRVEGRAQIPIRHALLFYGVNLHSKLTQRDHLKMTHPRGRKAHRRAAPK